MNIFDIRKFLMGTGVLIGSFALAFTSQVLAQDDSANNLDDEDVEEITVTGSRIMSYARK